MFNFQTYVMMIESIGTQRMHTSFVKYIVIDLAIVYILTLLYRQYTVMNKWESPSLSTLINVDGIERLGFEYHPVTYSKDDCNSLYIRINNHNLCIFLLVCSPY